MHDDLPNRPFNIGDVKGRPVIDANGDNVGTVADVVVEPGTWKVGGFVVSLRRDVAEMLHLERGTFGNGPEIEIRTERVRSVGDNVILNIDRVAIGEALRVSDAPGQGSYPETMPTTAPYVPLGPETYPPERPPF